MKRLLGITFLSLSLFAIGNAQQPEPPLTNTAVIKLVKAGFKDKTVITIINNRPANFKLDTDELIELKRNGVNENIIVAMLSSQMGTVIATGDEWDGDTFFKDLKRSNGAGDSQGQGSNVFGSGSSSQSQTRSGGGLGGNQNEGNVTGSATVRIIKPPVEGGGENASPKLEKTPTLNNEGVIRMVEAGFSEGTIIKRIEESPVDFDLSVGGVAELYKRRVTDAIIAAMKTAMGDKIP